jgi:thiol-disulfide isomerase/thioredoxin
MPPRSTFDYFCMLKTKIKAFFLILLISLVMLLAIPFITDEIKYNTVLSFTGYFFLTLFSFRIFDKKLSVVAIVTIIFATILVLQSFTIYTWFVWDTAGLPAVAADCFAVISAYFYTQWKSPQKFLPVFLSACFVAYMFFWGWDYWVYRMNYGTFTGEVQASALPAKFEATDENQNLVTDNNFQGKIVLLDFWFTRCGPCFEKFPQLQAVYDKYKDDPAVAIFAVDKPMKEDKPGQAFQMIKEKGYTFPVVIATDREMPEKLGAVYYPTTLVINRDGMIVFRGEIEGAVKMVDELKEK